MEENYAKIIKTVSCCSKVQTVLWLTYHQRAVTDGQEEEGTPPSFRLKVTSSESAVTDYMRWCEMIFWGQTQKSSSDRCQKSSGTILTQHVWIFGSTVNFRDVCLFNRNTHILTPLGLGLVRSQVESHTGSALCWPLWGSSNHKIAHCNLHEPCWPIRRANRNT